MTADRPGLLDAVTEAIASQPRTDNQPARAAVEAVAAWLDKQAAIHWWEAAKALRAEAAPAERSRAEVVSDDRMAEFQHTNKKYAHDWRKCPACAVEITREHIARGQE